MIEADSNYDTAGAGAMGTQVLTDTAALPLGSSGACGSEGVGGPVLIQP